MNNSVLSPQRLAIAVLVLAAFGLCFFAGRQWYVTSTQTYYSGSPPTEILEDIEAKSVPYDAIKPWAVSSADVFLAGSSTSSLGILFFGDYTDPASNRLLNGILPSVQATNGRVRLVWHALPASTDDKTPSFEAAVLSECSRLLDPAWRAHLLLSQIDHPATSGDVDRIALAVAGDDVNVQACTRDASIRQMVRTAAKRARGDGIDKAPFVFVRTQAFPASMVSSTAVLTAIRENLK